MFRIAFRIVLILALAYFAYDYREVRKQALCAHAQVSH
jgi:hypothetical protein